MSKDSLHVDRHEDRKCVLHVQIILDGYEAYTNSFRFWGRGHMKSFCQQTAAEVIVRRARINR